MVHRENTPECIQKYLELENSFPTLKIECVETYVKKKECYSVHNKCTTVEQSIQQCGAFKYSIYLTGSFFKAPCGNYVAASELQYIVGNYVLIKLTNGVTVGGFIVDVSASGSGNLILDVSSNVNLSNLKVGFDTLTYYPNSAYGFVNHCGFLSTQRSIDALPGQKLFLIDTDNEIHDVFIDAINESGIHVKPTLVHTSITKCNLSSTALPYNSINSGFYTVISPFIKVTTTEYEPHVVPYGFQKKYLLNNLTASFKNILNQYIKKVECWANTSCNVDDQENRLFFCSQPLAVFSCLAGQQYYLGHIQDIFSICGVTDYNILLTSPLNNFPVKTGELYILLGTIFTNNPDKTITIVDEKQKKHVNYTILSYPETLICNLSRLNPLNYFRDGDVLYNDSFVSSIPIEFVTIVTVIVGGKTEFVVEGLNNLVQSCNEHNDHNKQSGHHGNAYENLLRRYAQYNCNIVCNNETFQ